MGPFRLMDLIGLDVNFAATRSMWEQTFGEPRYRPHPLQARHGRSRGRSDARPAAASTATRTARIVPNPKSRRRGGTPADWSSSVKAPGRRVLAERSGRCRLRPARSPRRDAAGGDRRRRPRRGIRAVLERLDRGLAPDIPILCQTVRSDPGRGGGRPRRPPDGSSVSTVCSPAREAPSRWWRATMSTRRRRRRVAAA